ncbi:MAG: hypothetical protein COA69_09530 [Robiginitomaculum sp.]|nr:MAG: hypothetical protein COA69_09530 [Robiginitomaculum sp.]
MKYEITAWDDQGCFPMTVIIDEREGQPHINFNDGPAQYYLDGWFRRLIAEEGKFCLDAQGRNHRGSSVYVNRADIREIVRANDANRSVQNIKAIPSGARDIIATLKLLKSTGMGEGSTVSFADAMVLVTHIEELEA